MEDRVEVIILDPRVEDLPMLDKVVASADITVVGVVSGEEGPVAEWLSGRDISRYDELQAVPRVLPGQMLMCLGEGLPSPRTLSSAASAGLLVINRDVASLLCGTPVREEDDEDLGRTTEALKHYNRLLADYLPTSRHSTTAVKLAACLAEAIAALEARGGVIMTGKARGGTLALAAQHGSELPREYTVSSRGDCLLSRCFFRGRSEVEEDLSSSEIEFLPGVDAVSAACVPIRSGQATHGVLGLWSEEAGHPWDLSVLPLFAYYVAVLLEVDELGERLRETLSVDPLTGLHNRRQFDHRLQGEIHRAERYTFNVSLIIFDIDNLEEYNDTCGHMLGNLALSDIASIFKNGAREVDFVARIGGDEFGLILPETNRLGAVRVADRLRGEVAAYPFPVPEDKTSTGLTVSAGISSYPGSADNEQDLLARAYQALEIAKSEGTDSIKLWEEPD